MTYGDIYEEFCKKFPNAKTEDYRPADEIHIPQLARGIPNAIIVWLKDGSKIIYIAESEEQMTKTVCDICGKPMPTRIYPDRIEDLNFCISTHGRIWDICVECAEDFNRWMTIRRAEESEGT